MPENQKPGPRSPIQTYGNTASISLNRQEIIMKKKLVSGTLLHDFDLPLPLKVNSLRVIDDNHFAVSGDDKKITIWKINTSVYGGATPIKSFKVDAEIHAMISLKQKASNAEVPYALVCGLGYPSHLIQVFSLTDDIPPTNQ